MVFFYFFVLCFACFLSFACFLTFFPLKIEPGMVDCTLRLRSYSFSGICGQLNGLREDKSLEILSRSFSVYNRFSNPCYFTGNFIGTQYFLHLLLFLFLLLRLLLLFVSKFNLFSTDYFVKGGTIDC